MKALWVILMPQDNKQPETAAASPSQDVAPAAAKRFCRAGVCFRSAQQREAEPNATALVLNRRVEHP